MTGLAKACHLNRINCEGSLQKPGLVALVQHSKINVSPCFICVSLFSVSLSS